jgi:phage repressor protein C with HTH and peptisase S24 domain
MSQRQVAASVGVRPATVSQWETGREKPGRERLLALSRTYNVTVEELVGVEVDENSTGASVQRIPANANRALTPPGLDEGGVRQLPLDIPVLGTGVAGGDGEFVLNGTVSEYVRRPPGLRTAANVFAVWITGDSMYPAFRNGDLAYVHPGRQPRVGDDVLIELQPEPDGSKKALVKRLVKLDNEQLIVEQFNPAKKLSFAVTAVSAIFKILTIAELMGI